MRLGLAHRLAGPLLSWRKNLVEPLLVDRRTRLLRRQLSAGSRHRIDGLVGQRISIFID